MTPPPTAEALKVAVTPFLAAAYGREGELGALLPNRCFALLAWRRSFQCH